MTALALQPLYSWLDGRALRRAAFAFVGGVLLSRTFSPVSLFPLIFIAFPVAIIVIDRARSARQAFNIGWWYGFGFFAASLNWIAISFSQQDRVPAALGPFAIAALAAAMALYIGLVFAFARMNWSSSPWRVVLFAAVWTLFEVARGVLFTGFPWSLMGSIWADWLWPLQGARLVSVYGLSFLTVWLGASVILLLAKDRWSTGLAPFLCVFMLFTAMIMWGGARLATEPTRYHDSIQLRLVQANVPQRLKWVPSLIGDHFDRHVQLSRGASATGTARHVSILVWPEASVQRSDFDREGSILRYRLSRLLEPGAVAIVGANRYEWRPERGQRAYDVFNSLFVVGHEGDVLARYDKRHLVPFGEYLPFQDLLNKVGIEQLTGGRGFATGTSTAAITVPDIPPFQPLICYEAIFPAKVRDPAGEAQWMLNITNDGWFGISEGPHQHLALAKMRAVEEGLPLVRSASTGISAVVDPVGRITVFRGVNQNGTVDAKLPLPIQQPTAISTYWRIIILLILLIIIITTAIFNRKNNHISR